MDKICGCSAVSYSEACAGQDRQGNVSVPAMMRILGCADMLVVPSRIFSDVTAPSMDPKAKRPPLRVMRKALGDFPNIRPWPGDS